MSYEEITELVSKTLVRAGSTFPSDRISAYEKANLKEESEDARWCMETIVENARTAEKNRSPLCDDTGIPHLLLDVGKGRTVSSELLEAINRGIEEGLHRLPGRPMAIKGDDYARLDQSGGLSEDPASVLPAPLQIRSAEDGILKLHILMQGGGPAIRGKTLRVYHRHSLQAIEDEIVSWAIEGVRMLGCSPCTLCIGIGRSQYEAAALLEQAQVDGKYEIQSEMERKITERVNEAGIGPLGLGGSTSVLATFMKVGPQRASGVRVVSLRPCCCFEPRVASLEL